MNKRGKLCRFFASLEPPEVWTEINDEGDGMKPERMFYKFDETFKVILYDLFEAKSRPNVTATAFNHQTQCMAVGFEDSTVLVVNIKFDKPIVVKHLKWVYMNKFYLNHSLA